jgi:hypothetical protein
MGGIRASFRAEEASRYVDVVVTGKPRKSGRVSSKLPAAPPAEDLSREAGGSPHPGRSPKGSLRSEIASRFDRDIPGMSLFVRFLHRHRVQRSAAAPPATGGRCQRDRGHPAELSPFPRRQPDRPFAAGPGAGEGIVLRDHPAGSQEEMGLPDVDRFPGRRQRAPAGEEIGLLRLLRGDGVPQRRSARAHGEERESPRWSDGIRILHREGPPERHTRRGELHPSHPPPGHAVVRMAGARSPNRPADWVYYDADHLVWRMEHLSLQDVYRGIRARGHALYSISAILRSFLRTVVATRRFLPSRVALLINFFWTRMKNIARLSILRQLMSPEADHPAADPQAPLRSPKARHRPCGGGSRRATQPLSLLAGSKILRPSERAGE